MGLGLLLLPALITAVGPREAIPILAIVQFSSNLSRIVAHWQVTRKEVGIWYAVGALPMALLGTVVFNHSSPQVLTGIVGLYMLLMPAIRRFNRINFVLPPKGFVFVGAGASFFSAILGVVGPILAPFFLALGLSKGAYIGTDALGSVITHGSKVIGYLGNHLLSWQMIGIGLGLSPLAWVGTLVGKWALHFVKDHHFALLIDGVSVLSGIWLLWRR